MTTQFQQVDLQAGTKLGPYEVVSPIAVGGMGEVYRAYDTRLGRSVAIKVLSTHLSSDPALKKRFQREARAISLLNHPNICSLYDVGESGDNAYLVMEYLDGETLAKRLSRGAIPLGEALGYAIEIAAALERAHRAGVVHRDLKPGNVMLTSSGAKLLDFGLARLTTEAEPSAGPLTADDALLGTMQYMSPEQLSGSAVDHRSDIFSFGVMLYEMLSGVRPFAGENRASVIGAILFSTPEPVTTKNAALPAAVDRMISACLQKDREERVQSARDLRRDLEWIRDGDFDSFSRLKSRRRSRRRSWALAGAALLAGAAFAAGMMLELMRGEGRRDRTIARLTVPFPPGASLSSAEAPGVAISPDGRHIVYSATRGDTEMLFGRDIDRFESTPIAGSDFGNDPFFSPDGEWLAFFTDDGHLKKVRATGGAVQTVAGTSGAARGGTWAPDGMIYYAPHPSGGLWRVSANGGTPEPFTRPAAGENSHRWPQMLPDGRHLLFTIRSRTITSFDEARIAVLDLSTRRWNTVFEGGTCARYLPTGHLLFGNHGRLFAAPFDRASLTASGTPRPVLNGIVTSPSSGAVQYAVAEKAGTLLFIPGNAVAAQTRFVAIDDSGLTTDVATIPQRVSLMTVAPDGQRLALEVAAANDTVWSYDLARRTAIRLSLEPGDQMAPSWSADGRRIFFHTRRGLFSRASDGSGRDEQLFAGETGGVVAASPDRRYAVFTRRVETTGNDLWTVSLGGAPTPAPLLQTQFNELDAAFSPDGRFIAYTSDDSGVQEVYVRTVEGGARWKVSTEGGGYAHWSPDGRRLYYRKADDFYVVPIVLGAIPSIGKPALMFSRPDVASYDVYGDRLLLAVNVDSDSPASLAGVVLNWFADLEARVPR